MQNRSKKSTKPFPIPTRFEAATCKALKGLSRTKKLPVSTLIRQAVDEFINRARAAEAQA